jgi:hypothetical protein
VPTWAPAAIVDELDVLVVSLLSLFVPSGFSIYILLAGQICDFIKVGI